MQSKPSPAASPFSVRGRTVLPLREPRHLHAVRQVVAGFFLLASPGFLAAAESAPSVPVEIVDGIVMPRRPVPMAIVDAMQFLKKADGDYMPGRIDGDLAGYFSSALVKKIEFPTSYTPIPLQFCR